MSKARPYYETSYKLEVAKMVVNQGFTQVQVCKDLNISQSALARLLFTMAVDYTQVWVICPPISLKLN